MYQQEIKFFWPLTEQIPLDLDYSGCCKPKLSIFTGVGQCQTTIVPDYTKTVMSINSNYMTLDVDYINVKVSKKPNIFTRGIYKLIGLKWEVK